MALNYLDLFEASICLLIVGFIILTTYIFLVHRRYEHLPGPPYKSFYFGHLPELWRYHSNSHFHGILFHQWIVSYGPVLKLFFGPICLILVADTTVAKELLTKSKYVKASHIYKRLYGLFGQRFLGSGLLTETNHDTWRKCRTAIDPAFRKKNLRVFMEQFNRVGDRWMEKISTIADGQTVFSMQDKLSSVTLDVISEVGFGYRKTSLELNNSSSVYLEHIMTCLKGISKTFYDPLGKYKPNLTNFRRSVRESIQFLRAFGKQMLSDRRSLICNGVDIPDDILTYIIKSTDESANSCDEDSLDNILTFFVAGQETTANTLSFLFSELGRRPEIAHRVQQEVDRVLDGKATVTYHDLNQLEYLGQVIKETLRLFPPAHSTTRFVEHEVSINGYRIPGNSNVAISFFAIHRHPNYYQSPEDFIPERFSSSAEKKFFTFMPFSAGQRTCIGQQFAMIEMKLLMAKFFRKFSFKLDPNQSFDISGEVVTLRPTGRTMMSVSTR